MAEHRQPPRDSIQGIAARRFVGPGGTIRKLLVVIGGPLLLVVGVTVGVVWWDRGAPPGFDPPVIDVALEDLNRDHRGVRFQGTAHYEARVAQSTADGERWSIFPVFPKGDTMSRDAHVLVRMPGDPDALYSFEDLRVEGMARPPGRLVPRAVREAIYDAGYSLTDDFVLVEQFTD